MLNVPTPEGDGSCFSTESRLGSMRPISTAFNSLYKVTDEVLGEGLNGKVKLAVHRQTGKKVAVKTYSTSEMHRKKMADLTHEVMSQSSLDHPNVARLEAVFQSKSHVLLLVEHLSGGDVFKHLMEVGMGKIGESHAASVVHQLLSAVEHMHARGLVHRDIKLENVMYTGPDRDTVKLIDFGFCAKWKEGDMPMTQRCGTAGYMAPELVRQHGYTSMADMWSVGVFAHALLTGDLPGRNSDRTPILSDRMAECSPEAQKFVTALLVVDPADRLTAQQALTHSWMLSQEHSRARCNSTSSTSAGINIKSVSSIDDIDCISLKQWKEWKEDFSPLYPSPDPSAPKREKNSLWQALPTFRLGASRKLGAMLSGFRTGRSTRVSRVSLKVDL